MDRITNSMTDRTVLANLESSYSQLSQTEEELSSGTQLTEPSQNPLGASEAMGYNASLAANAQYQTNVTDGTSWMAATDTALTSMNNDVQSAQNLIIQASSGTVSTSQMSSIAAQLNELADSIKTTANTQVNGDYIFSGTATQTEPFTVGGTDTYAGNSAAVSIEVGQGVTMQTNVTGNTVVSPILAAIRQAVTDMGSGGTPGNLATTDLQAIQAAQSTLGEAQVFVGSGENRLAATTTALQAQSTATTSQLSSVQDTDIASTMINFHRRPRSTRLPSRRAPA